LNSPARSIMSPRAVIDGRTSSTITTTVPACYISGEALVRFDAVCFAYCLMGNHYHFVVETRRANLSRLMRHVNGVYTQRCNRRHKRVGRLFQGRFKAIIVDRDAYFLEMCRYVDLNPVRARLVRRRPQDWRWSSYIAHVGLQQRPEWLDSARGKRQDLTPRRLRDTFSVSSSRCSSGFGLFSCSSMSSLLFEMRSSSSTYA
jgi:hypothetical protein